LGRLFSLGIIDKKKQNLWFVSLGDSDAGMQPYDPVTFFDPQQVICGRMQDGQLTPVLISKRHNVRNAAEVERVNNTHQGDKIFYQEMGNRVLGFIDVTGTYRSTPSPTPITSNLSEKR